jgi:hypothetical protein
MTADPDTLLTALYVELTDRIIPLREPGRRGPGRPPQVTDAELACLAVAQVLLRHDDERHWLRAAPRLAGHLFPRLLAQSQYNTRLRQIAPPMEAALRWLADAIPATAELLRLMDATPVPCGTSAAFPDQRSRPDTPCGWWCICGRRVRARPACLVQADPAATLRPAYTDGGGGTAEPGRIRR